MKYELNLQNSDKVTNKEYLNPYFELIGIFSCNLNRNTYKTV